jgi:hypothetical protein
MFHAGSLSHHSSIKVPRRVSVEHEMRISTTPNATPKSTPPTSAGSRGGADDQAGDRKFIWTVLVPRLIHPTKLAIIETLIEAEAPLSVDELIPRLPTAERVNSEVVRYHAISMVKVGVLEVDSAQSESNPRIPYFYFPPHA